MICSIHNLRKTRCRQCGGSELCIHDKQKLHCKICGKCSHGILKTKCLECKHYALCSHMKKRVKCRECNVNLPPVQRVKSTKKRSLKRKVQTIDLTDDIAGSGEMALNPQYTMLQG